MADFLRVFEFEGVLSILRRGRGRGMRGSCRGKKRKQRGVGHTYLTKMPAMEEYLPAARPEANV